MSYPKFAIPTKIPKLVKLSKNFAILYSNQKNYFFFSFHGVPSTYLRKIEHIEIIEKSFQEKKFNSVTFKETKLQAEDVMKVVLFVFDSTIFANSNNSKNFFFI